MILAQIFLYLFIAGAFFGLISGREDSEAKTRMLILLCLLWPVSVAAFTGIMVGAFFKSIFET